MTMPLSPEALDKRLALLEQAVNLGFVNMRTEIMQALDSLSEHNKEMCANFDSIEKRMDMRISRLEEASAAHQRAIDRIEPWFSGLAKAVWIVMGLMIAAMATGGLWAAFQSGALP